MKLNLNYFKSDKNIDKIETMTIPFKIDELKNGTFEYSGIQILFDFNIWDIIYSIKIKPKFDNFIYFDNFPDLINENIKQFLFLDFDDSLIKKFIYWLPLNKGLEICNSNIYFNETKNGLFGLPLFLIKNRIYLSIIGDNKRLSSSDFIFIENNFELEINGISFLNTRRNYLKKLNRKKEIEILTDNFKLGVKNGIIDLKSFK